MTRYYAEDVTMAADLSAGDEVIARITSQHKQRDGEVWFEYEPVADSEARFVPAEYGLSPAAFEVGDYLLFEYTRGGDVRYAGQARRGV